MSDLRQCILLPHSILGGMRTLSREDRGDLFTALLVYSESGSEPEELSPVAHVLFDVYRQGIDRDKEAYAARCAQNRRNRVGRERPSTDVDDVGSGEPSLTGAGDGDQDNAIQNSARQSRSTQGKSPSEKRTEEGNTPSGGSPAPARIGADGHWRSSLNARRATAQQVVDALENEGMDEMQPQLHNRLFDLVNGALERGMPPEEVLRCREGPGGRYFTQALTRAAERYGGLPDP